MKKYLIFFFIMLNVYGDLYSSLLYKPKVLLSPNIELVMLKNATRMTFTIHKLFGDSILEEIVKNKSWCIITINISPNGKIKEINVTGNNKNNYFVKFINSHKFEIIKKYTSTYCYFYSTYVWNHLMFSFLRKAEQDGYYIRVPFPYVDIIMEDNVKSFLEKIAKYEYCPIKTSIDEGIMPESYFWYIKEFQKIYGIENQSH